MPGKGKKIPFTDSRKRVTASARARISTKRVRKDSTVDNIYRNLGVQGTKQPSISPPKSANDQIMALLNPTNPIRIQ